MGKANCPFCNSKNTFNIAYGYLREKKEKKNYIDQHDIGKILVIVKVLINMI